MRLGERAGLQDQRKAEYWQDLRHNRPQGALGIRHVYRVGIAPGRPTENHRSGRPSSVGIPSGSTQADKATLLNCIAAAISGGDRVIRVEEVFDIKFLHPGWVGLQTRQEGLEGIGEIRLRVLIKGDTADTGV